MNYQNRKIHSQFELNVKTVNMNFKINQKVVCVNNRHSTYCSHPLVKGGIYTVYGFYTCSCGSEQILVEEIKDVVIMQCKCSRTYESRHTYYSWRFKPLDLFHVYGDLFDENYELGEKSDLPVLQPEIE